MNSSLITGGGDNKFKSMVLVELLSLKNRQFCALFDKSMKLGT